MYVCLAAALCWLVIRTIRLRQSLSVEQRVSALQEDFYNREIAVDITGNPRFDVIASAYGIEAENINDMSQAEGAIKKMLASEKPYLLQVFVDKEERTII